MPETKSPTAYRGGRGTLIAGVATGIAAHFSWPVWAIRAVFVAATAWKFSGAVAYGLLWLAMSVAPVAEPIGLVAAERAGRRPQSRQFHLWRLVAWLVMAVVGAGLAWFMWWYDTSFVGAYAGQLFGIGLGVALVWTVRDAAWRWGLKLAVAISGVVVAWASAALLIAPAMADRRWADDPLVNAVIVTTAVMGATVVVCVLAAAPWIIHPMPSAEVRQAELVAQARADMASHLHDSVLQTLSVIQRQAGDAAVVGQLARTQEKELRQYLYGERLDDESFKAALAGVASEIEATYTAEVDVVFVGDAQVTPQLEALVAAAREALVNAAKHSGADRIDVYAEVRAGRVQVFVRDRGRGFAMEDVSADRLGIRRSIIERMTRFGGRAHLRSTPGEGTEVELDMPTGGAERD